MAKKTDLVDALIKDWANEIPNMSTCGIGVAGRILRLGRQFEARVNALLKPHGLSYTDFDVLATLRRSGVPYRLPPTQLMKSVLITSGAMTAALDRLTRVKMIKRAPHKTDRRSFTAELTPKGKAAIEKVLSLRFEDAENSINHLSNKDIKQLEILLRKLTLRD
ncbi:MAG: MarR family transcriptional regulator [Robiginitomaculum sp.]|nr:MarR family transcriptional regulator [Robiginitomaculum sp.]